MIKHENITQMLGKCKVNYHMYSIQLEVNISDIDTYLNIKYA